MFGPDSNGSCAGALLNAKALPPASRAEVLRKLRRPMQVFVFMNEVGFTDGNDAPLRLEFTQKSPI